MNRRRYIDWMRGLAVLCMIEHHTFDAFLRPELHGSAHDRFFRFMGGVAAPSFLFLAGLAMALMLERKGDVRGAVKRGALILLGAYLFRVQEWALAFGGSPAWTILRIDVLNCIGVGLVLVALCWRLGRAPALLAAALLTAVVSPWIWSANLGFLPHHLEDYLHGHSPSALFPLFPWLAHAFLGGAVGVALARVPREREGTAMVLLSMLACAVWITTRFVDALPFNVYASLSWWDTSPAYFLLRNCSSVWLLALCWAADRVLPRGAFADPLLKLGQHSLLVYWVHIEIVYGRWFWRARGTFDLAHGALALAGVLVSMIALSYLIEPLKAALRARRAAPALRQPAQVVQ